MRKTMTRIVTVEINTEARPIAIAGLRDTHGGNYQYIPFMNDEHGCLDAPFYIPAGGCYKTARANEPDKEFVYDSVTVRGF